MVQINELGYRRWTVPLSSMFFGWTVITETGVTLAWRGTWIRRMMLFASLPALLLAFGFFFYEQALSNPGAAQTLQQVIGSPDLPFYQPEVARQLAKGPEQARHTVWSFFLLYFFRVPQGVVMVLVVGLIAPRLIAQDVRSRAFLLYFSRPISVVQYVLGKSAIVWVFIACITTIPATALYFGGVLMSPDISVVWSTYDLPFRILVASVVLIVPTTSLALCFSSMTTETRNAGFMWFATWIVGWVAYASLAAIEVSQQFTSGVRQPRDDILNSNWSLLSLYHTLGNVQTWIFGLGPRTHEVEDVPWASILLLTVLTIVSVAILFRRVTAPLRV